MKVRIVRDATRATLLAAALLAACLFVPPANAQSEIQGTFTLPFEVRWGQAVLPPGDYLFISVHSNTGTMLVVRDAKTHLPLAYESAALREDSAKGETALLVGTRGKQRIVHSVRIVELGSVFVYDPELARGRGVKETRQSQTIPMVVAKK